LDIVAGNVTAVHDHSDGVRDSRSKKGPRTALSSRPPTYDSRQPYAAACDVSGCVQRLDEAVSNRARTCKNVQERASPCRTAQVCFGAIPFQASTYRFRARRKRVFRALPARIAWVVFPFWRAIEGARRIWKQSGSAACRQVGRTHPGTGVPHLRGRKPRGSAARG